MARGADTWDAPSRSTLEESAESMARGAATWDAAMMSKLEESVESITKQRNSYSCISRWLRIIVSLSNMSSRT